MTATDRGHEKSKIPRVAGIRWNLDQRLAKFFDILSLWPSNTPFTMHLHFSNDPKVYQISRPDPSLSRVQQVIYVLYK